jgi:hypothetical protein
LLVWYHFNVTWTKSFSHHNYIKIMVVSLISFWSCLNKSFWHQNYIKIIVVQLTWLWYDLGKIIFTSTLHQNYIKITSIPLTLLFFFFDTSLILLHYIILRPFWCYFYIIITITSLMSIGYHNDIILIWLQYNISMIILIISAWYVFHLFYTVIL